MNHDLSCRAIHRHCGMERRRIPLVAPTRTTRPRSGSIQRRGLRQKGRTDLFCPPNRADRAFVRQVLILRWASPCSSKRTSLAVMSSTLGDRILGDRVDVGRGFDDDANPHFFD